MKNKVLAATYNPVTKDKMFTVMIDVPYCLLLELLEHKELTINYKKIKDITLQEILENPYIAEDKVIWKDILNGCVSKMTIDVNSDSTINEVNFDTKNSSGWLIDYNKLGIKDMYKYLLEANSLAAHNLLMPFAYTTCIINGTNWNNFFEKLCPKYELLLPNGSLFGYYKSKKDWLMEYCLIFKTDSDLVSFEDGYWESINTSVVSLELQNIAETIYDLYQEVEWKETEYHIPFEEDINNKFTIEKLNDY